MQYKIHFDGSVTPLELETKDGVDIRINGAVQETWTFASSSYRDLIVTLLSSGSHDCDFGRVLPVPGLPDS